MSHLPRLDPAWLAARPSTPLFCEENVWQVCRALLADDDGDRRVWAVFVTNATRTVAMWAQQAAVVDPIVWDYHVVTVVEGADGPVVLDVDCRAGTVLPLRGWLQASFRAGLRSDVEPRFRIIPARVYVDVLASDRSHMRDDDGQPLQPFPPWQAPNAERPGTLQRLIDLDDHLAGDVFDAKRLARRFGVAHVVLPPFGDAP